MNTNLEVLLSKLHKVKQVKTNRWMAACPAHGDVNPSLSISLKNNRILIHCMAGCDTSSVLAALDAQYKDLFQDDKPDLIAVDRYPYTDENDKLLFYTIRYLPKTFKQCHTAPNGEIIWSLEGVRRVLYHLSDVIRARDYGDTIYITEGEKDCDNIWLKAFKSATCNPMGAGKWRDEYTQSLKGAKEVIIIPDNDQPGRNHTLTIAQSLLNNVGSVKILLMPAPFKDFSDWMESLPKWDDAGHPEYDYNLIPTEFEKLITSAIEYTPAFQFPSCYPQFTFKGVPA